MIDINKIKDNSIIICPDSIKSTLLKELDKNKSTLYIKFLSKQELFNGVYFDYDYNALYHVHKAYNLNYGNAKEILDILCGPLNNCSDKTRKLLEIYDDLKKHSLLKFNSLFKSLFNNKNVYITGYSCKDNELTNALTSIGVTYEFLESSNINHVHTVYKFISIEDEVLYLFNSIAKLTNDGVSLNDIFLYKYPGEYQLILDKYRNFSKIPMEIEEDKYLKDSPLYTKFKEFLKEKEPADAFNELDSKITQDNYGFLPKLSSLIIKLASLKLEKEEFIELLDYLASKKTLSHTKYDNAIRVIDNFNDIKDNQYVFMLGFDVNNYPIIKKDMDYLSDEEKKKLGRLTSTTSNSIDKEKLIKFILNTKNLVITFKEKNNKNVYYPSLLIKELNLNEEKGIIDDNRYFDLLTKMEIAKYKDNFYKYGEYNEYTDMYDNDTINYKNFDHTFKKVNIDLSSTKLKLSYTTINEFNECPFKYFAGNVLKAKTYESTYYLALGNFFHKVLEDSVKKEINMNDYDEYIKENFPTNKDKFFLKLHLEQLKDVLEKNKEFNDNTFFKKILPEQELSYKLDENTTLTGKIDKTMIDNSTKKIAVVDYKSGSFKFEAKNIEYGLCLQLPIYKLLLENAYPDYEVVGLFIQRILVNLKKADDCNEKYYLNGLFCKDINSLKLLDGTWLNSFDDEGNVILKSRFISSLSLLKTKPELSANSIKKTIPDDLSSKCKEKVMETVSKIKSNDFSISPLMFDKQPRTLVCGHCSYKDICFMKRSDIRVIKKGGDE